MEMPGLTFWGTVKLFPKWVPFYILATIMWGLWFLYILRIILSDILILATLVGMKWHLTVLCFLCLELAKQVLYHWATARVLFDLYFCSDSVESFSCAFWLLVSFMKKYLCKYFAHFKSCCLFIIEFREFLIYSVCKSLITYFLCKHFSILWFVLFLW